MLGVAEAAEELDVHPDTLRRWADKGQVPVTMTPTGWRRFSPEQMEEIKTMMRRQRIPPEG